MKYAEIFGETIISKQQWTDSYESSNLFLENQWTPVSMSTPMDAFIFVFMSVPRPIYDVST